MKREKDKKMKRKKTEREIQLKRRIKESTKFKCNKIDEINTHVQPDVGKRENK